MSEEWTPGPILSSPGKADLVAAIDEARVAADIRRLRQCLTFRPDTLSDLLRSAWSGRWFLDSEAGGVLAKFVELSPDHRGELRSIAVAAVVRQHGGRFAHDGAEWTVGDDGVLSVRVISRGDGGP